MSLYKYTIYIMPEEDKRGYYVIVPVLPGCFSQGQTIEGARKNIQKAISLHIKSLKKQRQPIPKESDDLYQTYVEVAA